jgi:hypothetical protein
LDQIWDTVLSYLVALGTIILGNMDSIVSWGGFLLLIVRLIADVPRAYNQIRSLFKK